MQVDLVKSFATNIYLQNLASIQPRTSLSKFDLICTYLPRPEIYFSHRYHARAPRAEAGGVRSFAALAVLAVCGFAATWRRYRLRQKLRALLVAFSVCCIFFASPALAISTRAPAQTESGGRLVTIGVSAFLALVAYLSGSSADRKEDRRVKEEAKKLEARQAELELDGEVLVDESMSELLKDRENELAKGPTPKSEEDLSDDEFFEQRNEQLGARREQEDDANDNASGPSAEDIARMKRMFGGDSTGTDGMGDR